MTVTGRTTAVAVFERRSDAERAVEELRRAAFMDDNIGLAVRRAADPATTAAEGDERTATGVAAGAVGGATVGGIIGALAAGLVPGLGPVLVGGILAGVLGGAATGGVAGGLLGALVGMGVPEQEAAYYDERFRAGGTVLTVRAGTRRDEALAIMRRHGGETQEQAASGGDSTRSAGGPTYGAEEVRQPREYESGYGTAQTDRGHEGERREDERRHPR